MYIKNEVKIKTDARRWRGRCGFVACASKLKPILRMWCRQAFQSLHETKKVVAMTVIDMRFHVFLIGPGKMVIGGGLLDSIIRMLKRRMLELGVLGVWLFLMGANHVFAQSGRFTVEGDLHGFDLNIGGENSGSSINESVTRLYAYYMTGLKNQPDTIEVHNKRYCWKGKVEMPEKINLMVAGDPSQAVILFIEPGKIEIRHNGRFSEITVKGSQSDREFRDIEQKISALSRPVKELRRKLTAFTRVGREDSMQCVAAKIAALESRVQHKVYRDFLSSHPSSLLRLYAIRQLGGGYVIDGEKIDRLFKALPVRQRHSKQGRQLEKDIEWSKVASFKDDESIASYVRANPGSPVALAALMQYGGNYIDAEKVKPLFRLLPREVRQSKAGVKFGNQIEAAERGSVGQMAPLFTQKDTAGKDLSLIQLRGSYVLLDFWASWCVPCRAQNPVLTQAYKKYKENGFTILSVALERPGQKKLWLDAIAKDQLSWYQVSDFKYWQNDAAELYGVLAIPQNFLIDPRGRIVAKNLFGEQLGRELARIFGKDVNH